MLLAQIVETTLCCNGAVVTNATGGTSEWMDQVHSSSVLTYTTFARKSHTTGGNESQRKYIIKLRTVWVLAPYVWPGLQRKPRSHWDPNTCKGSSGKTPRILHASNGWRWVINLTPRLLYSSIKCLRQCFPNVFVLELLLASKNNHYPHILARVNSVRMITTQN
jgi:hypothetical protein